MHKINQSLIESRPVSKTDHALIYISLLRSYRKIGAGATGIPKEVFYNQHKLVVEKILENCLGICAVNPGDPHQIYGYVLFEPGPFPILHYVYVKQTFRQMGLGNWLLGQIGQIVGPDGEAKPVVITHRTTVFRDYIEPKGNYTYNPYLLGEL